MNNMPINNGYYGQQNTGLQGIPANYATSAITPPSYSAPPAQPMMTLDTVAQVSGIDGANSYPVAACHTALLVDFPAKTMWIKSTDMRGVVLPLEEYSLTKIDRAPVTQNQMMNTYATKEEVQDIKNLLAELNSSLVAMRQSVSQPQVMIQPQPAPVQQSNNQQPNNRKRG